jgi:hypothetical protein
MHPRIAAVQYRIARILDLKGMMGVNCDRPAIRQAAISETAADAYSAVSGHGLHREDS